MLSWRFHQWSAVVKAEHVIDCYSVLGSEPAGDFDAVCIAPSNVDRADDRFAMIAVVMTPRP